MKKVRSRKRTVEPEEVHVLRTRQPVKVVSILAVKRFMVVAACVVVWILLAELDLFGGNFASVGTLILSVILFLLAIPVSIVFRMDTFLLDQVGQAEEHVLLLWTLPFVLANFLVITNLRNLLRPKGEEPVGDRLPTVRAVSTKFPTKTD